jgi:hypothetical protein
VSKEPKIPARVQRLVRYLQHGRTLCMHIRKSDVGEEYQYWLEPDGNSVGEWTVKRALDMGLIAPSGDALFPDMESQTYRAA